MKTLKSVSFLLGIIISFSFMACNSTDKAGGSVGENPALANIFARKSVRKYLDKEVEDEKITTLLKAGMAAPSGKNVRPWEFVVVKERAALDSMAAALPYAKMLTNAPVAIIVCGDLTRSSYWYLDCSAAAQNILLAAEALDLGAVWTAAYPYDDRMDVVRKYTDLPGNILPLCVIPVGYPTGLESPKDKFDEKKIHYEKY